MESQRSNFRWILCLFIVSARFYGTHQLNLLAYDNCEMLNCPVDCNVTFSDTNPECPSCECTMGQNQRCLPMNCPAESHCQIVQRLDGCPDCACRSATFELFDENRNMNVFSTDSTSLRKGKETCSLLDAELVERCMFNMLNYMKLVELKNANLVSQPLYAMFLYESHQISEICSYYNRALRCLNIDVLARCRDKQRHLHMVDSMFQSICDALSSNNQESEIFGRRYECLRNILTSHHSVDYCAELLSRRLQRAARAPSGADQKRADTCAALNNFLDCAQPAARDYCAPEAARLLATVLVAARRTVAPECDRDESGTRFVPWPTTDGSLKFRFGSVRTVGQERKFVVASSTSKEKIGNGNSNDILDGNKLADLLEQTYNARKATLLDFVRFNESVKRDSVPKNEEFGKELRSQCDQIPQKNVCPDTSNRPQSVVRWYKRTNDSKCESYQYSFCGLEIEARENPIKFKEQCTQLCL